DCGGLFMRLCGPAFVRRLATGADCAGAVLVTRHLCHHGAQIRHGRCGLSGVVYDLGRAIQPHALRLRTVREWFCGLVAVHLFYLAGFSAVLASQTESGFKPSANAYSRQQSGGVAWQAFPAADLALATATSPGAVGSRIKGAACANAASLVAGSGQRASGLGTAALAVVCTTSPGACPCVPVLENHLASYGSPG